MKHGELMTSSLYRGTDHCNQAEANDAAAAQIAAQTPNADNRTSIQIASLVREKAASHPDLSDRNGWHSSPWSLTTQRCCDMKLRSISSSLDCENRHCGLVAAEYWGDRDRHQTALTLTAISHYAVYCTSKSCPPRFSNRI
jgi:hypothetical protein